MKSYNKDEKAPITQHRDPKMNEKKEHAEEVAKMGSDVHTHDEHTENPLQKVTAVDAPKSVSDSKMNPVIPSAKK
jgi:hypothetical protein